MQHVALRRDDFEFDVFRQHFLSRFAASGSRLRGRRHLLRLFARFFDRPHHVERLLGHFVVLSFDDFLEAPNRVFDLYVLAFEAGELLGDENGCDRNLSILRARATVCLSSSDSSSMPRMAMMSCRSL